MKERVNFFNLNNFFLLVKRRKYNPAYGNIPIVNNSGVQNKAKEDSKCIIF